MATVSDGSDFAQDFIRLLRNENNALRSQIQQLEQQRASGSKPPSYDDVHAMEMLRKQCRELLDERNSLRTQVAATRNAPCTDVNHMRAVERVKHLEQQVSEMTLWKETEEQSMRTRISELEDTCRGLESVNTALVPEPRLPQVQPNAGPNNFNVKAFLSGIHGQEVVKPKLYKGPFSNVLHLRLPKDANDLMPYGSMRYSQAEMIWKSPGASQFLAFGPMHIFNHNLGKGEGKWERALYHRELTDPERPYQKRDILFLHNHAWHYYGTYECVGSVPLTAQMVEEIGSAQIVAYAEKRTLLDSEHAPSNMGKLVHSMYAEGKLKIECFGFRRAGFNEALNSNLSEKGAWAGDKKSRELNTDSNHSSTRRDRGGEDKRRGQGRGGKDSDRTSGTGSRGEKATSLDKSK